MKKTLLNWLEKTPPFWVFALARNRECRKKARRYTRQEIATRSGLSLRTVDRISGKLSWNGTKIEHVSAFLIGCGTDVFHVNVDKNFCHRVLNKGGKLPHLTPSQLSALNRRVQRLKMIQQGALTAAQNGS